MTAAGLSGNGSRGAPADPAGGARPDSLRLPHNAEMANNGVLLRAGRAAAACAALIALAAACSGGSGQSTATPPAGSTPSSAAGTPGRLTAQASGVNLTITDAVAHLGAAGPRELTMTVRNDGDVPEHLAMVATTGAGRGTLQGMGSGNGSLSTAGVLLMPHTTVVFGGNGPRVLLPDAQATGSTLPVTLQFGVVGLVHLQAEVARS